MSSKGSFSALLVLNMPFFSENTHNTTSPSAAVLSLQPDHSYTVRVAAVFNGKMGPASMPISVRTKPERMFPSLPCSDMLPNV